MIMQNEGGKSQELACFSDVYCFIYMANMFSHTHPHPLKTTAAHTHTPIIISDLIPLKSAHTLVCCLERVSVYACVSFAQFGHFNMRHCLIYNRGGGAVKAVYDALMCPCSHLPRCCSRAPHMSVFSLYKPKLKPPAAQRLE